MLFIYLNFHKPFRHARTCVQPFPMWRFFQTPRFNHTNNTVHVKWGKAIKKQVVPSLHRLMLGKRCIKMTEPKLFDTTGCWRTSRRHAKLSLLDNSGFFPPATYKTSSITASGAGSDVPNPNPNALWASPHVSWLGGLHNNLKTCKSFYLLL